MELFEKVKSGPLKPAPTHKSTKICDPVKIRYVSGCNHPVPGIDEQPITIPEFFSLTVEKYPNNPAIIHKDIYDIWHSVTYHEYYKKVIHVAKQFIKLGLEPYDSVGIIAANCPEWFYTELGAFFVGATVAGVYATNSPDAVHHALELCSAKFVIVDDHLQMEKIFVIKERLPNLKYIIQINGPYDESLFKNESNEPIKKYKMQKEYNFFDSESDSEYSEDSEEEIERSNIIFLKWNEIFELKEENKVNLHLNNMENNENHSNGNGIDNEENELSEKLMERLNEIAPNQCCLLIYTSGTVGFPKAVMLSHDNLITNAKNAILTFPNITYGDERMVSYLPLNHIVGQIFDIFITLLLGGTVYIAEKDAIKSSLMSVIAKAKPTRFFGVPRVFEKMQDKISLMEKQNYGFLQAILNWAKFYSLDYNLAAMDRTPPKYTARYWMAQNILTSVKTVFGLEKCKYFLTGGAPTSHETKKFFLEYDMRLYEIYGLSETSGGVAFGDEEIKDFDAIGRPVDGIKFKVQDPNSEGYGEICVKTRSNLMGYVNEPLKTDETLDSDGWLHTGDYGCIDKYGYLYITGRIKEIVITSGGENIAPYHVENLIKIMLPGLNNVFLVGDCKKYLTVLVTIKTEIDSNTGMPLDFLHPDALEWMKSIDLKYKTLSEILKAGPCSKVQYSIADGIKRANMDALSNAQKVQKFRILPNDFSMPTGELGPTLKVKRNFVLEKYSKLIDEMYKE